MYECSMMQYAFLHYSNIMITVFNFRFVVHTFNVVLSVVSLLCCLYDPREEKYFAIWIFHNRNYTVQFSFSKMRNGNTR